MSGEISDEFFWQNIHSSESKILPKQKESNPSLLSLTFVSGSDSAVTQSITLAAIARSLPSSRPVTHIVATVVPSCDWRLYLVVVRNIFLDSSFVFLFYPLANSLCVLRRWKKGVCLQGEETVSFACKENKNGSFIGKSIYSLCFQSQLVEKKHEALTWNVFLSSSVYALCSLIYEDMLLWKLGKET